MFSSLLSPGLIMFVSFCWSDPLQEAENALRMTQHKQREEDKDLMRDSCKTNTHTQRKCIVLTLCYGFTLAISKNVFSVVKDEDSDMDVPEDEGSDSDMEELQPSKPRSNRNGIMAGTQS